jgi:hypothetical protein
MTRVFPGLDIERDSNLRSFLCRPIDTRDSFPDATEAPKRMFTIRSSAPTEEIKSEWDFRVQRIHAVSRALLRRPVSKGIPEIAAREMTTVKDVNNPYNSLPVEDIASTRNQLIAGPRFAMIQRPQLRPVPRDLLASRTCVRNRRN